MEQKIECVKCGWVGGYGDLIAPTSDHEPSCPECLGDDFVDVDSITSTTGGDEMSIWHDVEKQEDVDMSEDGKELHIMYDYDDSGNKYVSVPIELVLEAIKMGR